jgi:hypothetical protein
MELVKRFWVMTPCIFVGDYKYFGEVCCLHLQGKNDRSIILRKVDNHQ